MSYKRVINVVETHGGEPMRVVTGGVGHIPGNSVYEMEEYLRLHDDSLRKFLLREPRGYPAMCCNVIVPPKHPEAAAGFIIMEQTEYPMMSGGNVISVATVLLENGMIPMKEGLNEFNLEAPAGLIGIRAQCHNGKVTEVTFKNVPSFAVYLDKTIDVPHLGKVTVDVAWGGMFYVIADIRQFPELELLPEQGDEIIRIQSLILGAAREQLPVHHPDYPHIELTQCELSGPARTPNGDLRNAVRVSSGKVDLNNPATWKGALDRCPCGTGTCAKMAVLHAKGLLPLHQKFRHEGLLDIVYTGELVGTTKIGEYEAVIPEVSGQSWIYGYGNLVLDPTDPFTEGFTIGDIWG